MAARRLAAAGFDVVCLERGTWTDPSTYPGDRPEWELLSSRRWSSSPAVRRGRVDYPIDTSRSDLGILDFKGVGGGTILYNAQWPRMMPDDFRVRSVDGVADDWPIGWDDLVEHYERTDIEFGVSGLGDNPALPQCAPPPLPAMPIGEAGLRVARGMHELGWHWWPATNAIASIPHGHQRACVQRGSCGQGCNEGAKGSTDRTHWPDALADGARLVTDASVTRILTDGHRAVGAEWIDLDGATHRTDADVVLCAMNAIGTARVLLASTSTEFPDGLANRSGLVGRRLMLHPLATVVGVFDDDLRGWRAHNGGLIQSLEFATSDPSRGFIRGSTWGLGSSTGPMRALLTPDPTGVWGAGHGAHVRSRLGHIAQWAVLCEDLPEDHNRVVLDPTTTDHVGMPGVRIEYRLSDNSRSMMAWMIERAGESLVAAGARSVESTPFVPNGHLMGTARMGDDPRTSVVDRFGMSHDVEGLGVIDGSVFVTAGSANPTTTIVALASRTADHLIATRTPRSTTRRSRSSPPTPPIPVEVDRRSLDDAAMVRFIEFAELLVGGDADLPPPRSIDLASRLATVFEARPDLREPVEIACSLDGSAAEALTELDSEPSTLRSLRYAVAGAYWIDPTVREAIGYRPGDVRAADVGAYPEWMAEGLADHLL